MKKLIFSVLILAILLGVGYLTFKGRMPVLSEMIYKQVELDVKETPDEMYNYYDEIGYVNNLKGDEPKSGELVFEGGIEIEHTFTQSEINSWIAAWEGEWADLPFKNSQIRINSDGTVEASSLITVSTAESFAKTLGYTDEEISKAKNYIKFMPELLPLYAKGTAAITENNTMVEIQDFKIAGYTVPSTLYSGLSSILESLTERTRKLSDYTDVASAIVTSEGVSFKGTVPASVNVK